MTVTQISSRRILAGVALLAAGLVVLLGAAGTGSAHAAEKSAAPESSSSAVSASSVSGRPEAAPARSAEGATSSRVRKRFFLPLSVAGTTARRLARQVFISDDPRNFDQKIIEPSDWNGWGVTNCRRGGYSRVLCRTFVTSQSVKFEVDGQVFDYKNYTCRWTTTVFYPVAKRRTLKLRISQPVCPALVNPD